MITLAFYKGRASHPWWRMQDYIIRFATSSQYSHVELISGDAVHGGQYLCYSSSGRDGGVRSKQIFIKSEIWDLVAIDITSKAPVSFINQRIGAHYDMLGVLLSQGLHMGLHNRHRWFCSEICAAALGLEKAHRVSPQMLFEIVSKKSGRADSIQ